MENEKITLREFYQEVFDVEGVKINIPGIDDSMLDIITMNHYPYDIPMDGDFTVNDLLDQRIKPCLTNMSFELCGYSMTIYNSKQVEYRNMCDFLGIDIVIENINPKKKSNAWDCAIRSISKVLNKSWDDVYKDLSELGFQMKELMNTPKVISLYLSKFGFEEYIPMGYTSVGYFAADHKSGKYLIGIKNHMIAYINGTFYDTSHNIDEEFDSILGTKIEYIYTLEELD